MLELITGPMMSGKTTELLRRLERHQIAGRSVVLLRPATDTRETLTHVAREHNIATRLVSSADELREAAVHHDVIGIDEVQFFGGGSGNGTKYASLINELAARALIICSGLNATSEVEPWHTVQALIPHADDISYMHAVCVDCGSQYASRSFYVAGKSEHVAVGGSESYVALCRSCYSKRLMS